VLERHDPRTSGTVGVSSRPIGLRRGESGETPHEFDSRVTLLSRHRNWEWIVICFRMNEWMNGWLKYTLQYFFGPIPNLCFVLFFFQSICNFTTSYCCVVIMYSRESRLSSSSVRMRILKAYDLWSDNVTSVHVLYIYCMGSVTLYWLSMGLFCLKRDKRTCSFFYYILRIIGKFVVICSIRG